MHAVHVSTLHPASDPRILHRQCVTLARAGARVTYLGTHGEDCEVEGVQLRSVGRLEAGARGRARALDRVIRGRRVMHAAAELQPDVIHLHDPELLAIVRSLRRRCSARIVFDSHEDSVAHMLQKPYLPRPTRRAAAVSLDLVQRLAVRRLDAVVTADEGVAHRFRRIGAEPVVLHNFVRQDLFDGVQPPESPAHDLAYHGSLPRTYLQTCFAVDDALCRLGRQARWLFVARLIDADQGWAAAEVARRGAEDRFQFHPRVPHTAIAETIVQARLGIIPLPDLPKFHSNIPTKLFEFMALGMPVVLSDLPPTRHFVAAGDAAVAVLPDDAEAYAFAIDELLSDPRRCERMGESGRAQVAGGLNWRAEARKLVALYERLTGETLDHRAEETA